MNLFYCMHSKGSQIKVLSNPSSEATCFGITWISLGLALSHRRYPPVHTAQTSSEPLSLQPPTHPQRCTAEEKSGRNRVLARPAKSRMTEHHRPRPKRPSYASSVLRSISFGLGFPGLPSAQQPGAHAFRGNGHLPGTQPRGEREDRLLVLLHNIRKYSNLLEHRVRAGGHLLPFRQRSNHL